MRRHDKDGDGELSKKELEQAHDTMVKRSEEMHARLLQRFDADSKRGLVSRRGRYLSPARRVVSSSSTDHNTSDNTIAEFPTFRSKEEVGEVPSLCSAGSGEQATTDDTAEPPTNTIISCNPTATSPLRVKEEGDKVSTAQTLMMVFCDFP